MINELVPEAVSFANLRAVITDVRVTQILSAGNFVFKVNNRNTRTRCERRSKLTINTPEQRQWPMTLSGVVFIKFEYISHLVLMFSSLTLNTKLPIGYVF